MIEYYIIYILSLYMNCTSILRITSFKPVGAFIVDHAGALFLKSSDRIHSKK